MSHSDRLLRARCALEGLSVGDAFGEQWFYVPPLVMVAHLKAQTEPSPVWNWTDDTQMALSIYSNLRQYEQIEQNVLALSFARQYSAFRGYGSAMRGLFDQFKRGIPWNNAAHSLFAGQGSYGNGAAMRVAPVAGYFTR